MPRYRTVSNPIAPLAVILLLMGGAVARAQSPCDSCMRGWDLFAKWDLTGDEHPGYASADFQLQAPGGRVLVDHVRGMTRDAILQGRTLRQALRVRYGAGESCRDTLIPFDGQLTLHRVKPRPSPHSADVPISPAREYRCDDLLATGGVFIGAGAVVTHANNEGFIDTDSSTVLVVGPHLLLGLPVASDVDVGIGAEVYSVRSRIRIPISGYVRWSPFGGTETESELHYVPDACRFMGPGDAAMKAPKSVCAPLEVGGGRDSSVYAVEERFSVPQAFMPFLYGELGMVIRGVGSHGVESVPLSRDDKYIRAMEGIGIGAPIIRPIVLGLGFRHVQPNINAAVVTVWAEFR